MTSPHRYIIGIDLGTTNSAVSYADLSCTDGPDGHAKPEIRTFKVPQLTGPGEVTRLPVLPSFLYLPGSYEITREAVALPWPTSHDHVSGSFARDHGSKVPTRLVSSAKSWLCHDRVDRRARILPWGADESIGKISPIQASAAYLTHIRQAWNHAHGNDPEQCLENQFTIVTVPASFDETARDLTLEAAALAGFGPLILIEEPLAAFYSWLIRNEDRWQEHVAPGELILVCDVGGGTTDFTLITLRETEGSPRFERIAVGDHLILGGDNMDIALARTLELELGKRNISLSGDRFKTLCHQCRRAKETLLNGESDTAVITLMGEGSRLISGTLRADLTRSAVDRTVIDGFFPIVSDSGESKTITGQHISEFGLPYESESAVTRHLGVFLNRHQPDVKTYTGKDTSCPDLILFNGGALKPPAVQERIRESIRCWFGVSDSRMPRVLDNPHPDLAVSLGAVYYGLVKTGIGVRVGSGSPRAYYLGISQAASQESSSQAICLVERGIDEGTDIELNSRRMKVLTNQPVRFDIYSSSFRSGDRCGDIFPLDDSFTRLPPLQTVIEYGKKDHKLEIPVRVEARYTEMGTLSLWCRSETSPHRWQLQFQLRDNPEPLIVSDPAVLEASVTAAAQDLIRSAFSGAPDRQLLSSLVKAISKSAERKKDAWPLAFIRALSDELLDLADFRLRSPESESRWMNLLGYCLRPGRGDGFDSQRVKSLWKLYTRGPAHGKNPQVRSEWWIMWRRVAGGMSPGHQRQISQDLTSVLISGKGKPGISPQERLEMWMLIANLEQLLAKDKVRWGEQLLSEITTPAAPSQLIWAVSRIGARELLYGPADRVIAPEHAFSWCRRLMQIRWRTPTSLLPAITSMARKTGDRIRDLNPSQMEELINWMSALEGADIHSRMLREVVPMALEEETMAFGESLPSGLVLHL